MGVLTQDEHAYPQIVLKSGSIEKKAGDSDSDGGSDTKAKSSEFWSRKVGKAATLVMFQPSAPAGEPTAWIRVPSQP